MRYPPDPAWQFEGALYREAMPPPGYAVPKDIRHGDIHLENVLLAGVNPMDPEHRLSPQTKVSWRLLLVFLNIEEIH